ncbi:hypothetical protein KL86PLE_60084 [uncultured Pleomorphomonas sp.]|uniref:Uncharacterized protein n=1 Tax=uncultured Pleomorphomonas sp. TaxID=442121 RepID=A0A212LK56_9HYPH|nr:hypothetical protein KL86PLE_60084 [uncultured Pleomorphomonas sp.]
MEPGAVMTVSFSVIEVSCGCRCRCREAGGMKKVSRAPGFSAARPLARRLYTMGKAGTVKVFALGPLEITAAGQVLPFPANQICQRRLKRCGGATIFVEKS